jgi:MFS transporter, AAHS family, 4-hydroxybenzoate transporter
MSAAQLAVVVLCTAALIVDGYDIQVMALAVPSLAKAWALPPSSFGLALSGVVIGITAGSLFLGPLGDRFGRRTMLIVGMAGAGLATAATALAGSPGQFVLWRCVTGAALGAAIPSCAALTFEFSPLAHRSFVMGLVNCGPPIGAFSAGFIAPPVLDAFGWRGTFLIGGAGPLVIAALALWLPESLKFLLVRSPADSRIARALRKVAPEVAPAMLYARAADVSERRSPADIIRAPYLRRTLLLWGMVSLNLFNLYVLVSWLSTFLEQSGWSSAAALRGAVLIQAGGVIGGLSMSRFLDRGATRAALIAGFLLCAASLASFALVRSPGAWIVLLLLVGAGVSGSQLSLNTLSAAYYPPAIKATGVAWALVIGGIGSILGPLAGGWLIELRLTPVTIMGLLAVPSLLCAAGASQLRREWQAH